MAISLFSFNFDAVIFTVVGVLSEVTVMFLVVHAVNNPRSWYDWG